jgi:hypothetical protein
MSANTNGYSNGNNTNMPWINGTVTWYASATPYNFKSTIGKCAICSKEIVTPTTKKYTSIMIGIKTVLLCDECTENHLGAIIVADDL